MPLTRLHVIPVGGAEPMHVASPECWCFPISKTIDDVKAEFAPDIQVHNAKDCRDAFERVTGKGRPGEPWIRIGEHVP